MSLLAGIALRVAGAVGLVAVNAVVLTLVVGRAVSGGSRSAGGSRPRLLAPFEDALGLLAKEDTSGGARDAWLLRGAPLLALAASFLALLPLAVSEAWRIGGSDAGLVIMYAALGLAASAPLVASVAAASPADRLEAARAGAVRLAYGVPLALSLLTPLTLAGTASLGGLVDAQRGTWLFGLLPRWFITSPQVIAFALFAVSACLVNGAMAREGTYGRDGGGDGTRAYSGARLLLLVLADHTAEFVVAAMGTTVFLGGWLVPYVDRLPFIGYLGAPLFLVKAYALMYGLARLRGMLPRAGASMLSAYAWSRLVPLSLLWVIGYGVVVRVTGL